MSGSVSTNSAQLILAANSECGKCGAKRIDAQIGLEETPEAYVSKIVEVFREVRRVLKNDGTLWLNLGDTYNNFRVSQAGQSVHNVEQRDKPPGRRKVDCRLKEKDLCGIPWRVAFALQAGFSACTECGLEQRSDLWPIRNGHRVCIDCLVEWSHESKVVQSESGWYLRSDIIWHKPNPMPESVTDRPTKAHEYIFLLSKSERYFYDAETIREPVSDSMMEQIEQGYDGNSTKLFEAAGAQDASATKSRIIEGARKRLEESKARKYAHFEGTHGRFGNDGNGMRMPEKWDNPLGRNKRSVWTVPTAPCAEAHFATFPPDLIKPCILAGSRPGDTVLDPFLGSGTTAMVALELGRKAIGIELNPEYVKLSERRCEVTPGLGI